MMVDENSRHGVLGEGPAVNDLETTPPETLAPATGPFLAEN